MSYVIVVILLAKLGKILYEIKSYNKRQNKYKTTMAYDIDSLLLFGLKDKVSQKTVGIIRKKILNYLLQTRCGI